MSFPGEFGAICCVVCSSLEKNEDCLPFVSSTSCSVPASASSGGGGGSVRGTIGDDSLLEAGANGVGGAVDVGVGGAVGGAVGGGGEESSLRPLAVGSIGWSGAESLSSQGGPCSGGGMDVLDGDPSQGNSSPV